MGAFSLRWPSAAAPARYTTPFDPATGAVGVYAPTGTLVSAGAAGQVIATTGGVVLVKNGAYTVTYGNVRAVRVQPGQTVAAGDILAESAGPESFTLTVEQAVDVSKLLAPPAAPPAAPPPVPAPAPTPPAPAAPVSKVYVRTTLDGVRLRERPVDGQPIGQVNTTDVLESLETAEATRGKLGVPGQWLQVRNPAGKTGFVAAQYLQISGAPAPAPVPAPAPGTPVSMGNVLGVNLDIYNPLGRPDPVLMRGIGWVRVKFNVSLNPDRPHTDDNSSGRYGNTDIGAAFNRYRAALEPYARAGMKVLMVFTHQLYGEGAGYNWNVMDSGRWRDLTRTYADFARRSVELWKPTGFIHAYQIWNEQDTEAGKGRAAVPIPAADYGHLLAETIRAVRAVDPITPIITGGHTRGPQVGSAYARATLAAMPADVRPDGIATHPYGRGMAGHVFSNWGPLEEEIRLYAAVLPGKPVWITEWGVLGRQGDLSIAPQVADYAAGFMRICKSQFAGQVAAAIWYAWADGMDDGYGLVDAGGRPKASFTERFLAL
ncbi:MAG: hypothetical protein HXY41_17380 [Chloroflexi bacterium]|nr:hypothetical protein [Chloroflexota bacterium]